MTKRFFAGLFAFVLLLGSVAYAKDGITVTIPPSKWANTGDETVSSDSEHVSIDWSSMTDEEIAAEIAAAQAELESRGVEEATPESTGFTELSKGSKGDDVKKLQQRLVDLNYLSGGVDGSYGNGTANAVSAFQKEAGLPETGIADEATQNALFADDAPKSKVYNKLDYKAVARDPDAHEGDLIKFQGKVLQVMEDGKYVVFRISSKGNYDDVVYCIYVAPDDYKRILEDDKVTVYGTCTGIYTYETIMGGSVTIPSCVVDRIELR